VGLVGATETEERGLEEAGEVKAKVCRLLREVEGELAERGKDVPAGAQGLFHVRRAMELIGCTPKEPVMGSKEKELFERGIIVE
jgi:hypothetical protein